MHLSDTGPNRAGFLRDNSLFFVALGVALVLLAAATALRATAPDEPLEARARLSPIESPIQPEVDQTTGRIRSVVPRPDPRQRGVGRGGELMLDAGGETFDRVTLVLRPESDFGLRSLGLRPVLSHPSVQSIHRRGRAARISEHPDGLELNWYLPEGTRRARIELPRGAEMTLTSIVVSRDARSHGGVLVLCLIALLLPALALADCFYRVRAGVTGRNRRELAAAAAAHAALCIAIARLGFNFDLISFEIVADLNVLGQNIYESTTRYNYGVAFAYLLGALRRLQDFMQVQGAGNFHMLIVAALCSGTVMAGGLLARVMGRNAALLLWMAPTGLLLLGYHSQIEPLALALAIPAVGLLAAAAGDRASITSSRRNAYILGATLLLGASLAIKHVLLFFPPCLLLIPQLGSLRTRIAVAGGSTLLFFFGFGEALIDPVARGYMVESVFKYGSQGPNGWIPKLTAWIFYPTFVQHLFEDKAFHLLWLGGTALLTMRAARRHWTEALAAYLIGFFMFSPSIALQYLFIPLVALALTWKRHSGWPFIVVSTALLLVVPDNVGSLWRVPEWLRLSEEAFWIPQVALLPWLAHSLYVWHVPRPAPVRVATATEGGR